MFESLDSNQKVQNILQDKLEYIRIIMQIKLENFLIFLWKIIIIPEIEN